MVVIWDLQDLENRAKRNVLPSNFQHVLFRDTLSNRHRKLMSVL